MRGRQTDQRGAGGLGRENVGEREALRGANSKTAAKRLYSPGAVNHREVDMGFRPGGRGAGPANGGRGVDKPDQGRRAE